METAKDLANKAAGVFGWVGCMMCVCVCAGEGVGGRQLGVVLCDNGARGPKGRVRSCCATEEAVGFELVQCTATLSICSYNPHASSGPRC